VRENLEQASPDLLRAMVKTFAEALMGAEADASCGASYRESSPERVNRRSHANAVAAGGVRGGPVQGRAQRAVLDLEMGRAALACGHAIELLCQASRVLVQTRLAVRPALAA
jgi:hypothetical protein